MEYRQLGKSDIKVSVIGYGGWEIGWKGYDLSQLEHTIIEAIRLGINLFDTAPVYGFGKSEEILGNILKPFRDKVIIATKVGLRWDDNGNISNNLKRDSIMYEIDMSLKRLGTDRIDLYQVHWPDPNTPLKETFSTLRDLLDDGVISYVGVSNFGPNMIEEALNYCPIISNQIVYNYFQRGIERELIGYCESKEISIIAYSPLCQGLALGIYDEKTNFSQDDNRLLNPSFGRKERYVKNVKMSKKIIELSREINIKPSTLALSWVLRHKSISSALVGTTKVDHLHENIKIIKLDDNIINKIDDILNDPELFY
ncbi:MAG: aldo/keto reductase [Spirochaetia bacterium]|nr:aldo/keto reductase [Spirochaetota bacterium]MCX8095924.1 aldo/keto reductase [Spirochaetota bacterium]MDW8112240.1 aldo/keto reductase [Spirochaetia bacterium]